MPTIGELAQQPCKNCGFPGIHFSEVACLSTALGALRRARERMCHPDCTVEQLRELLDPCLKKSSLPEKK
jgi:hypothetical protein